MVPARKTDGVRYSWQHLLVPPAMPAVSSNLSAMLDAGRAPHPFPVWSGEQSGKKRYKRDADKGDTAARHQLLHALGLGTGYR